MIWCSRVLGSLHLIIMAGGVRKILGGQRGRKNITRFPSLKMKRVICGESLLELDYHNLLEFDSDVLSFQEQPLKIEYILDGSNHFYTPDLLVVRANGQRQIIEVKREADAVRPENQLLFSLVRPICERASYVFGLALDRDIRREPRLRNVKVLLRYARTHVSLQHRLACSDFFNKKSQSHATVRELVDFCCPRDVSPSKIYALICRGMLAVNIHETLGPNSLVWLAGHILSSSMDV